MTDHLKTAVTVGGLILGVWGAGLTFGKSGEVGAVRVRQDSLEKAQDQLRGDMKEFRADVSKSMERQEATVEKAAQSAEQTQKAVEKAIRAGAVGVKGKGL